jgi:hypothetical protein
MLPWLASVQAVLAPPPPLRGGGCAPTFSQTVCAAHTVCIQSWQQNRMQTGIRFLTTLLCALSRGNAQARRTICQQRSLATVTSSAASQLECCTACRASRPPASSSSAAARCRRRRASATQLGLCGHLIAGRIALRSSRALFRRARGCLEHDGTYTCACAAAKQQSTILAAEMLDSTTVPSPHVGTRRCNV